jgi:hypothetical protein
VPRTKAVYSSEHPKPLLSNLHNHTQKKHPGVRNKDADADVLGPLVSAPSGDTKAAAMMEHYFTEHALENPMTPDTQQGFNKLFCEWALMTDQPFNVGEAPSLAKLFRFVHARTPSPIFCTPVLTAFSSASIGFPQTLPSGTLLLACTLTCITPLSSGLQ